MNRGFVESTHTPKPQLWDPEGAVLTFQVLFSLHCKMQILPPPKQLYTVLSSTAAWFMLRAAAKRTGTVMTQV